jgi:peptidoglycan/xylan/chitin deacetylase (PgdA/CDA1 family)
MYRRLKRLTLTALQCCGLFALARRAMRKRLRILCYHGFALADETDWRPNLFIRLETFRRRLDWLQRCGFTVLPLGEALELLRTGRLPQNPCVITIDDGFFGTIPLALPELKARNLPATVYVTTYYMEKETPIFPLAVQYMLWKTRTQTLDLTGMPYGAGEVVNLADKAERERAMQRYISHCETSCSHQERQVIARELGKRLGVDYSVLAESRIVSLMNTDEVASLAAAGIDIELHTHRHSLPADDRAAAVREIADNRRALEPLVGRELQHFCYPRGEWTAQQWPWLEEFGIASATTCISGMNDASTPRFCLRRFLDSEDVSEIEFKAEMAGVADLARRAARAVGLRR